MKFNFFYKKKKNHPYLWLFLDEDRIKNDLSLIKNIKCKHLFGVIVRAKKKGDLYKKAKQISKICRYKGISVFVSSSPLIALSVGADGVHFSKEYSNTRLYKNLSYSCSFHGLSDLRRIVDLKVKKVFISPIFKTRSTISKNPLGLTRLLFLSRLLKCEIGVLGGINKKNIKTLLKMGFSHVGGVDIFISN